LAELTKLAAKRGGDYLSRTKPRNGFWAAPHVLLVDILELLFEPEFSQVRGMLLIFQMGEYWRTGAAHAIRLGYLFRRLVGFNAQIPAITP